MSYTFDEMLKEATALPWTMGARLMVELRSTVRIPDRVPVMTKEAAAGLVKVARICKTAETPEEAQAQLQQAIMTDPNVVAAMDYQQAQNERETLMAKVQELQMAAEMAQAQAAMADQQATAASQQQEQLMALAQQAKQEQVNAVMESMQAKDQALQAQVSAQQHRQEIANFAQQMADQLKQIASSSPEERAMQEQAAQEQAQLQQEQAAAQQPQVPLKKKTQQQVQEAQNAQEKAQHQTAQAEQATQQEQDEQQQAAAMQQQAAAMGGQPKMGSARLRKIAAQLKQARLQKQGQFSATNPGFGVGSESSGQQGMFTTAAMGSKKRSKIAQGFATSNSAAGMDQGDIGDQGGMNQYAAMGHVSQAKRESLPSKANIRKPEQSGVRKTASVRVMQLIEKLANEQKAREIGEALGVNWDQVDFTPNDLAKGMEVEKEYYEPDVDVIPDGEVDLKTAEIALAHLLEGGDYYDRLEEMEAAMEADKDHSSEEKEKQGSFSRKRAAEIAQRVLLAKTGSSKKGWRGFAEVEPRHAQLVKGAAGPAAAGTAARTAAAFLVPAATYLGLGAAIGGGLEAARLKSHIAKYGPDVPTPREVELTGKLMTAKELTKRKPTYANKLREHNLQHEINIERLNREQPNQAAIRAAGRGAAWGITLGPLIRTIRKLTMPIPG